MALPDESKNKIREQYPQYAWAVDHGVLGPILIQSINEGWPTGRLQGAIMQTDWWKHTGPALRQWEAQVKNDPAATEQQRKGMEAQIWDSMLKMGMPPNAALAQDLAIQSLSMGWNDAQLQDALASRMQYDPNNPTPIGQIGRSMQALQTRASQWYVPLDDNTAFQWARSIAAGERTEEDYDVMFRQQAEGRFPTLKQYIDKGITPEQFFTPYKQRLGQLLEKDPSTIDLMSDSKYSSVIDMVDDKGERRPMTLGETDRFARGLDEWKGTRQGQETAAEMGQTLTTMFGKVAS